ncbi:HEAT repeat domain-containing protein [Anabaena sp. WFMT]|uniref:HEAT repeat domain-containing protein n=1 Tax=Anabaena sp. WFMT TaxID=3449730 RepID=UPI003F23635F
MVASSEFQSYLQEICCRHEKWWTKDALTETIAAQQATFSFEQIVQTKEQKEEREEKPQIISLPIFKGIQDHIESEHILLVGSPGVGKSTSLLRCLVSFAKAELEKPEPRIPVLIPLKRYKVPVSGSEDASGMLTLIRDTLEPELILEITEIKELLWKKKRLILLLDGLNEMPADSIRTDLKDFRNKCKQSKIPLICTTRELGSGDLGITRRLEIQPLSHLEINRFLKECMSSQEQKVLQLLSRDNRELSRTPFVLWMLYHVFQETGTVAETLGEAFREFFKSFKKFKEDAPVTDERRKNWNAWLEHLAFTMLNSLEPNDPGLVISDDRANKVLCERFGDLYGASSRIEELLKYHLLEKVSDKEISFHHQLIQEYYAAEYLLTRLPELIKKELNQKYNRFQKEHLNYLKWTEAIALMLGFPENTEEQAIKIIELALNVDLKLGAKLAGDVKPELQQKTVKMIAEQQVTEWFRIFLLGETKSLKAADDLIKTVKHSDPDIRRKSVWASRKLGSEAALSVINIAIEDADFHVRKTAIRAIAELDTEQAISLVSQILIKDPIVSVREMAVMRVLGKLDSEAAILELLRATQDLEYKVSRMATRCLEKMEREAVIPVLTKVLKNKNSDLSLRKTSADLLGKLGNERIIIDLFEAYLDLNSDLHCTASYAIFQIKNREITKENDIKERQESQQKGQINHWLRYLNSEEPIERGNAIFHLTSLLGKEVAIDLAIQALEDPHHYVRGHALTGLVRLIGKEAIPQVIKALDDSHCNVRDQASQELTGLRQYLPDNLEISEATISRLIRILNEDQDIYIQEKTLTTLTKLSSIQPNLLLNEDLENAFINASKAADNNLHSSAATGLGQFSSEKAASRLLDMVRDTDFEVALSATESLKNMPFPITAKYLPDLINLIPTSPNGFVLDAVILIQSRCQFYNYEIAKFSQTDILKIENFNSSKQVLTIVTDKQPIINFNQPNATVGVNYAAENSNIKFQQNVTNVSQQDLAVAAPKMQVLLNQLVQTYPITTEPQKQTFTHKFLELIESTPDLIKVLLAGGIEWLKILLPPTGIPIEMSRRLYEAVKERHSKP